MQQTSIRHSRRDNIIIITVIIIYPQIAHINMLENVGYLRINNNNSNNNNFVPAAMANWRLLHEITLTYDRHTGPK